VPSTIDETVPDVVIAPVVGFDWTCYRLGYGGGFFDLTRRMRQQCLLLALSGHAQCADECPLLGAQRTLTNHCLPISIYECTP
jgi:5-formyltetrahydrofolate cyclo-ligase